MNSVPLVVASCSASLVRARDGSIPCQYSGFRETNSVLPYLVEDSALPGSISIDNSEVAQVWIYTFQYAMATWLETLGIQAHAVMGHSLGEVTAVGRFIISLLRNLLRGNFQ